MVLITCLEGGREGWEGQGNGEGEGWREGGRYLTKICKTNANFEHAQYTELKNYP